MQCKQPLLLVHDMMQRFVQVGQFLIYIYGVIYCHMTSFTRTVFVVLFRCHYLKLLTLLVWVYKTQDTSYIYYWKFKHTVIWTGKTSALVISWHRWGLWCLNWICCVNMMLAETKRVHNQVIRFMCEKGFLLSKISPLHDFSSPVNLFSIFTVQGGYKMDVPI